MIIFLNVNAKNQTDTYIYNLHYSLSEEELHTSIFVLDPKKTSYNNAKLTEKKYNSISYKQKLETILALEEPLIFTSGTSTL